MAEYIIVTLNDSTVISAMNALSSPELIAAQSTFICWDWFNPSSTDLTDVEGMTGYIGKVQVS